MASEKEERLLTAIKKKDLNTIIHNTNLEEINSVIETLILAKKIMTQQRSLNEPPPKYQKELEDRIQKIKNYLDKAYYDTKEIHGKANADNAIKCFFQNFDPGYFTGKENKRIFRALSNHQNEIYQILLDYAISVYINEETSGINHEITLEDLRKYRDINNKELNYDGKHITEIIAIGTAWSPYYVIDLLENNPKLKEAIIKSFIKGRYTDQEQKKLLDGTNRAGITIQKDGKIMEMSKYYLNRCIENMNNDIGLEPFNPDNIDVDENKRNQQHR